MSAVTYLEAIGQAIREEMRRDEAVFLLGEDVGTYGGAFKVSTGLLEEFGPERVIDTPMAEAAIIGSAVGAALMGMRPIAEMQFIDFITCGFDQIINMASKMYWRSGMPVPIVIRGPSGGGTKGGPFHSASPEAWFFHTPGIKVVVPSTTYDAKGLLKAAVRDNNPVLYLEHKLLYRLPELREELPEEDYIVPLGKAITRREGEDMTVLTHEKILERNGNNSCVEESIKPEVELQHRRKTSQYRGHGEVRDTQSACMFIVQRYMTSSLEQEFSIRNLIIVHK